MNSLIKFALLLLSVAALPAEVRVHHLFDHNLVLQRDKPIRVWGWAGADERVTVEFAGQRRPTTAGDDGRWQVLLSPLAASAEPRTLTVKGPTNTIVCERVLVGDVWVLGGQSNMEFPLDRIYGGDLEVVSANLPLIRLLSLPIIASARPRHDFEPALAAEEKKGNWLICTPETAKTFSAIGYLFGRRLHLALQVPIGLIDASRGGTTVEAWTSRAMLSTLPEAEPLLKFWDEKIAAYSPQEDLR